MKQIREVFATIQCQSGSRRKQRLEVSDRRRWWQKQFVGSRLQSKFLEKSGECTTAGRQRRADRKFVMFAVCWTSGDSLRLVSAGTPPFLAVKRPDDTKLLEIKVLEINRLKPRRHPRIERVQLVLDVVLVTSDNDGNLFAMIFHDDLPRH